MHKCGCIVENILFMNKLYQDISVVIRDEFDFVSQSLVDYFNSIVFIVVFTTNYEWIYTSNSQYRVISNSMDSHIFNTSVDIKFSNSNISNNRNLDNQYRYTEKALQTFK